MAKSSHSVQKRRRELKMLERRQEKANRRAKHIEAKKLRAEAIERGEDPDAVIDAEATDTAEESHPL